MTEHQTDIVGAVSSPGSSMRISPFDFDTLEDVSFWREDLTKRIRRTQLVLMLADHDVDYSELIAEVARFKKVCRALAWREGR